jgi:hypothetical protein
MRLVTAVLKRCAKRDAKSGKLWCIYKHSAQDHTKILHPQPKGWPKHYDSKEAAKRGMKMMKVYGTLIKALHKVGANYLAKQIVEAYETQVTYPQMWTPDPTHTQQPKRNARDSDKSYSYPGQPLDVQYLSEDYLSRLGFTKPELICPSCRLKFARKFAYCPNCGQEYSDNPLDNLRSVQGP